MARPADDKKTAKPGRQSRRQRPVSTAVRGLRSAPERPGALSRRETYDLMVRELRARYNIRIRKWRSAMSGAAYELKYRDGAIKRLITAPRPRGPVSAAIFLHEVGHHAVGFKRYTPRCLEEFYVWQWALREMTARGIPITPGVLRHYHRSMFHYVRQAHQHGQHLPPQVEAFAHWPG